MAFFFTNDIFKLFQSFTILDKWLDHFIKKNGVIFKFYKNF